MEAWKGRRKCARKMRARKNRNRPPPRTVPSSIVQDGFVKAGTADRAWPTRREVRVVRAWDNKGTTGEIIVWNDSTCTSNVRTLARKSDSYLHDGPARHDVRPIDSSIRDHTCTKEQAAFAKALARERARR